MTSARIATDAPATPATSTASITADAEEPREDRWEALGFERVTFFSDAIFAIAMTLLVVDLRLPDVVGELTDSTLAAALSDLAPRMLAFLVSFAVIGLYWIGHWRRFHHIGRVDGGLVRLNLVLMGAIAFLPFPTAVLGEHGDLPIAVIFYVLFVSLPGGLSSLCWAYVGRHGLARPGVTAADIRRWTLRGLTVPAVMFASLLLLPFVATTVVQLTWLCIWPIQAIVLRDS